MPNPKTKAKAKAKADAAVSEIYAGVDWKSIESLSKPHGAIPAEDLRAPAERVWQEFIERMNFRRPQEPIREEPPVASRRPALVVGGILAVCAVAVSAIGLLITRDGDRPEPASNVSRVGGVPPGAAAPGGQQNAVAAPSGPFRIYLEPHLDGPGKNSKDCRYKLGLSLQWPQSPPYKQVAGETVIVSLQGPGIPPYIEVVLSGQGSENVDNLGFLTKGNLGNFTATIDTVGGESANSVAGTGSILSNTVSNPCGD